MHSMHSPTAASMEDMKRDAVRGLVEHRVGPTKDSVIPNCPTNSSDISFILLVGAIVKQMLVNFIAMKFHVWTHLTRVGGN
jgi:hypothetical protein